MATTPKCNNGWTICPCAPTSCSKYDGPTLPNSGVTSGDNLSVVLQKIDYALTPTTLTQNMLNVFGGALSSQFCDLINQCPTTTTTTTLPPPIIPYIYGSPKLVFDFSDTGSYSNSGTAVADLSGNANNGVFSTGTGDGVPITVTGYDSTNKWLSLPGTSDQYSVRISDALKCTGTSPFTYIMYCQPLGYSYNFPASGLISNSFSPGGPNTGVKWTTIGMGADVTQLLSDTSGFNLPYGLGVGIGNWTMYALTFDGTITTQYQIITGATYSGSGAYGGYTPLPGWGFFMGLSYNVWFKGNINYAAIYDTVLTQSELETIYAQLALRGY